MASSPSINRGHLGSIQADPDPFVKMRTDSKTSRSDPQSKSRSRVSMHADGHPSLSSRLTANTRQAQYRAPSSNADVGASLVEAAEPRTAQGSAPSVQLPWRTRPSVRVSSSVETVDLRVDRDVPSLPHPSLPQAVAPSASPTARAATATPLPPAAIYEVALKYWCRGPGPNGPSLETVIRPVHPITPVSLGPDGASGPLIVPPVPAVSARGTLYFEPRTVIRVAARWKAHPDESVADVLRWLLQRGIPVVWRVQRPPGLTVFVPPASDPDDFVLQAWSGWESPSVRQYQSLMQALLARPHARQWILRGGLAWRLALHYGSAHLLQDAVSGPSPSVLVEGRGDQYDLPVYSVGDAPSDAENAALVGKTGHGSFWPVSLSGRTASRTRANGSPASSSGSSVA